MESLTISPRFFKHELNNYYQWERAFWRELLQNSVDENCSQIQIELRQLPATHPTHPSCTEIKFQDNGPGMTEETLRNVYFRLGATSKEDTNTTIGGHGRARIITCFAHEAYTIRTQNILCQGAGGSFHIDNVPQEPHLKGCHIQILTKETTEDSLKTHLYEYLKTCQITASLTINQTPFSDWLHRRRATRLLSFGTIHTTKKRPNSVLVRVKGVTMFEKYSPSQVGAIIEIEPTLARSILTVSRDNLKFTAQEELERFLQEIAIDNKSLIRDQTTTKTEIYGVCKSLSPTPTPKETTRPPQTKTPELADALLYSALQKTPTALQTTPRDAVDQTHPLCPAETSRNQEDPYSLHFEDSPKSLLKAAAAFEKGKLQGRRKKLLKAWDTACRLLVQHVCEKTQQNIQYMPGFVFSPHLRGMHKKIQTPHGTAHILYLNPLTEKNTLALSPKDYHTLYALAAHEATHILHPLHNEDFAGTLTEIIEKTATSLPHLKKTLRRTAQE
jgi:hypothetical protein